MAVPAPMFWLYQGLIVAVLLLVYYGCGVLVVRFGVRANYTRKLVHFATFFAPNVVDQTLYRADLGFAAVGVASMTAVLLILFHGPIRAHLPIVRTMFAAIDRPEDRPHTLRWLTSQLIAAGLVLALFGLALRRLGPQELILIPIIVNGIGDGLAEPVGLRWGRHKFAVRDLFGHARFTRSVEGSLAVIVVGIVTVAAFRASFSPDEFLLALLVVPTVMTLAEALSPHTWDSPFLYLAGAGSLGLIVAYVA